MELRPYQKEAKKAVLQEWAAGRKRTLLVLATGCGKTIIFSSVVATQVKKGHRVLILAHRGELLTQAADKLKATTGLDAALEKADVTSLGSFFPVTVGSVQSFMQPKRLSRFPADYYQDIVIDEAHHCMSDSYRRVLDHFADANVLGVTATPNRADQKNLGKFFDSKAYDYSMAQAIKDGYLVPIRAQMIPLELDISSVKISNGDYSANDAGSALEPYLEQIAKEMVHYCQERKTVVFLPLIATSQKFCQMLNDAGMQAAEVNGNSPDRAQILADFDNGKYNVLCNSMLLTEGWDCPSVDCIVVLRPTRSHGLYTQIIGRGTRLSPGKKDLLILDFLWLTAKHDLCRPSAILCKKEEISDKIDKFVEQSDAPIDLIEAEKQAESDTIAERERRLAEELAEMRKRKRRLVDPMQYAMSIAADDLADYQPVFDWEMAPPTDKQLETLQRRGIDPEGIKNAGEASLIISRLNKRMSAGLSTPRQIKVLERYGFKNVGTWAFADANNMMTQLAQNSWRLPAYIDPMDYRPDDKPLIAYGASSAKRRL